MKESLAWQRAAQWSPTLDTGKAVMSVSEQEAIAGREIIGNKG
jgi:hypothetical protein